jgi:NADPH:quinone reductase
MKAVGFFQSHPIGHPESLLDIDVPMPEPGPNDLLVKVLAVSVNPVDVKRRATACQSKQTAPVILGYDACGDVVGMGHSVRNFAIGDRVFYAGDITRQGSNAEFQTVDYRVTGHAPANLRPEEAAALPLTVLTACEGFFDRMLLSPFSDKKRKLLIIGGAGGVGSIAIQIAKAMTDFEVVATASRPESIAFARAMGADGMADHRSLTASLAAEGHTRFEAIFTTADINLHWSEFCNLIAPGGAIGAIVGGKTPVDLSPLQKKSARFAWEFMFTRPAENAPDLHRQGEWLNEIAKRISQGQIRSTMTQCIEGLNATALRKAHQQMESGKTAGKTVMRF